MRAGRKLGLHRLRLDAKAATGQQFERKQKKGKK
jgi:hypothetical protein